MWPMLILFTLGVGLVACKKNSEFYNYQSKVKEFDGSVLAYLQKQPNTFDSLLFVLDRLPALKDSIQNQSVTLFAPTNTSFQAAIRNLNIQRASEGKQPMYLANCAVEQLDTLTSRYVLRKKMTTDVYADFVDGTLYKSLESGYYMHVQYDKLNASGFVQGGPQSIIFSDPKKNIFTKYWQRANTNAVNIVAKNGVINILAPLHDYGFNEFIKRVNQ